MEQLDLGLEFPEPPELRPGTWIVWKRAGGRLVGVVRSVHPGGITADQWLVIRAENRRGHSRPRTKPHFLDAESVTVIRRPAWAN